MRTVRLFVAVHLTGEIRERLAAVQERLRSVHADVSWVRSENLHITIKFLGEVEPKRLDRIRPALTEVARSIAPFSLEVAGMGAFGGRIPRLVWVGAQAGSAQLTELARRVEDGLGRVGFPKEKRGFTAHFTLGRVRSPRNVESLLAALHEEPAEGFGAVPVSRCSLMQSELNPSGSIYTELDRFLFEA